MDINCRLKPGFYLLDGDQPLVPFQSRGDAERFLALMHAFGEDTEGIEIVEVRPNDFEPDWRMTRHTGGALFHIEEYRKSHN